MLSLIEHSVSSTTRGGLRVATQSDIAAVDPTKSATATEEMRLEVTIDPHARGARSSGCVVGPDCGGYAALGPAARRFGAERRLGQHDGRHGRQPQCGHQTGQAAADDHRCASDIE